jgi:predicted ArsR family transcriptional regulator
MAGLHENQRRILEHLLDNPEGATLDDLAERLTISKTAAKEHLLKVESAGYITYKDSRGAVGRPRRRYLLSDEGHETFPRKYSWLSNVLLELLTEDLGEESMEGIMKKLADKVARQMAPRFKSATTTSELLEKVTETLNELGYRATLKQSDIRKGAIVDATNCVYHAVAKDHPTLCSFDIRFIENATQGMEVSMESCIAKGGSVCRFCIRKPNHLSS